MEEEEEVQGVVRVAMEAMEAPVAQVLFIYNTSAVTYFLSLL